MKQKKLTHNLRTIACCLLKNTLLNHSLFEPSVILKQYPHLKPSDAQFVANLTFGVLRWYGLLEKIVAQQVSKPLKKKDIDVALLLYIGAYQLYFLKTPPHAAVFETVAACHDINKLWAKGLINAVLKKLTNQPMDASTYSLHEKTSHPSWFIEQIKQDWGNHYQIILENNNQRAPLFIRVNKKKISRDAYFMALKEANIESQLAKYSKVGIKIITPVQVAELPGFHEGHFYVQDQSAQLAAFLLEPKANQTVLDACSAPGGKTTHLLEQVEGKLHLTAIEKNPSKLSIIQDNLNRLGLTCDVRAHDACDLSTIWHRPTFDRILLDAPCSGTGVIRRHPDIKLLRKKEDLASLIQQQSKLLHALWPLLKPNGILVYSTCSILKQENENQMIEFFASTPDAIPYPIDSGWGVQLTYGKQILPGEEDDMDGFYYARIRKAG